MRTVALAAAFAGWGVAGYLASAPSPGLGFLIGVAVGAGVLLIERRA